MLHDLDKTLEMLLKRELPPEISSRVGVSFVTPDDQFPPATVTLPVINLFLYDVQENHDLRDFESSQTRQKDGSVTRRPPPARIDCHYLVTACSSAQSPEEDEHRILGEALKVFFRYRRLPREVLYGSLKSLEPPVRARTAQAISSGPTINIWHSLKGKPRASFLYTLSLCVEVGDPVIGSPVASGLNSGVTPDEGE